MQFEEIKKIHSLPLLDLVFKAAQVHRAYQPYHEVQLASLLSIKTGGCSEDCAYCPQSAKFNTGLEAHALLQKEFVLEKAKTAQENGVTRFCMGAAWREVRDNRDFDKVIDMVKEVNDLGMEVCCTLGMISESQAQKLADAGLYAYNHNIDTSSSYYEEVITTRNFEDRLNTIDNVRKAGISVCSGGIIGMGESVDDRLRMLETLSSLTPVPESVPINTLVPVEGTPLAQQEKIDFWELLRMIATTRIIMPHAKVRLSAGRVGMSDAEQAFCFFAGANSIFTGEKLLTTPNPSFDADLNLLSILGLKPQQVAHSVEK